MKCHPIPHCLFCCMYDLCLSPTWVSAVQSSSKSSIILYRWAFSLRPTYGKYTEKSFLCVHLFLLNLLVPLLAGLGNAAPLSLHPLDLRDAPCMWPLVGHTNPHLFINCLQQSTLLERRCRCHAGRDGLHCRRPDFYREEHLKYPTILSRVQFTLYRLGPVGHHFLAL